MKYDNVKEGFACRKCWELFCETGEIGYYNLYKRLTDDSDEPVE